MAVVGGGAVIEFYIGLVQIDAIVLYFAGDETLGLSLTGRYWHWQCYLRLETVEDSFGFDPCPWP
jgi:hypothetical protein